MRLSILPIALAALMFGSAALGADTAPAGSAEQGKKRYVDHGCFACHGTEGQGGGRGSGPKISRPLMPRDTFRDLVRRPPRDMPAYTQKVMSDQELADMYAYLASLKPSPEVKDIPLLRQQHGWPEQGGEPERAEVRVRSGTILSCPISFARSRAPS